MRYLSVALILAALSIARAQVKIVHTNDDGWAVANVRAQFSALVDAGFNVSGRLPCSTFSYVYVLRTITDK